MRINYLAGLFLLGLLASACSDDEQNQEEQGDPSLTGEWLRDEWWQKITVPNSISTEEERKGSSDNYRIILHADNSFENFMGDSLAASGNYTFKDSSVVLDPGTPEQRGFRLQELGHSRLRWTAEYQDSTRFGYANIELREGYRRVE